MRINRLFLFGPLATTMLLASPPGVIGEPAPRLEPGETITIPFPEMPPTFAERPDPKGIPAMMTVFLPRNYDRERKHPLLIFLGGGGGGRGQNPVVARKLTEEMDFVCVDLPLFKEKLDPPVPGNGTSRLILQANDCRFMWSFHKIMLAKLEATVPNLDPAHRVLGGFSNGAHATAGLIDQSDGEVARRFSAFFFGEGGGRLEHYEWLKAKPFLMLYGSTQSGKRAKEIYEAAVAAGAKATLHEMKGVGHAFPESQYPVVRAWLRGEPLPASVVAASATAEERKAPEQTKTGRVKKVDLDRKQLTLLVAREMVFTVTDNTAITQAGEPMRLADIKVNDTVRVEYIKDGDTRTARRIEVQNVSPAAAPGNSQISVRVGAQTRT
ncbi:MAG TPA: DUF5666 domain-containing protein [Verrucomicrobiae bacterium]|nr:DUF5666 domain-containing protein [Verrucomicrobiae bacterium]